jgi:hypothetical protein
MVFLWIHFFFEWYLLLMLAANIVHEGLALDSEVIRLSLGGPDTGLKEASWQPVSNA